jgi:EAL domain-containing protein (putative c-di-GMP-specific phosphodiesterase class I)
MPLRSFASALPEFSVAFQPIFDTRKGCIYAYEALVRGPQGGSAADVLNQLDGAQQRYHADACFRTRAMELACHLGLPRTGRLSLNFMPGSFQVHTDPIADCLKTAATFGISPGQLILEITEDERVADYAALRAARAVQRKYPFHLALDDFGAGYSGLSLLADLVPEIVKIDMHIVRDVHLNATRHRLIQAICDLCNALNIQVIAEGVETSNEFDSLCDLGIHIFQGYYFARPAFEALPTADVWCAPGTGHGLSFAAAAI